MELRAYPRLSTRSRRAIVKTKGRFGRSYQYSPRWRLLDRLSRELGTTISGAYSQLMQEREYLLNQQKIMVK